MEALKKNNGFCVCCGRGVSDGIKLNVDHIKPRKRHPELALDINNLQVLCNECNHGKGNWDETDWRG
jgi:5-methylcytosine-specific restriction endonuclease McrA